MLQTKQPLTADNIQEAASNLMLHHPMLRTSYVETEMLKFVLQPMPNPQLDFKELEETDWKNVISNEVTKPFDTQTGPLWRVTYLPYVKYNKEKANYKTNKSQDDDTDFSDYPYECCVVFTFHHAAVDGVSYTWLYDEFLTNLQCVMKGNKPQNVDSMPMLAPLEYYLHDNIDTNIFEDTISYVLSFLLWIPGIPSRMIGSVAQWNLYTKTFGSEIERHPNMTLSSSLVPMEFSKEHTQLLLKCCKANKTSVQGAVQAASLLAIATMLQGGELNEDIQLPSSCLVNMRPLLKNKPVPQNYCGPYFASLITTNTITPIKDKGDFWKIAVSIKYEITKHIEDGSIYSFFKMLKMFLMMENVVDTISLNPDPSKRINSILTFTNLGNCSHLDRDNISEVKLRARYNCLSENLFGSVYNHSLMTFEGRLFWSIIYQTSVVTKETAETYAELVREIMLKYTR